MGVALRAEAEHGQGFVLETFEIGVFVGINFCGHRDGYWGSLGLSSTKLHLRARATLPVRVSSSTPKVSIKRQKLVHLAFVAGDFDGQALGLHIDDFGAENIGHLHDLGARLGIDRHAHEHQLAVDEFRLAEVMHFEHVDQLVELLDDLVQGGVVAAGDDGHAGGVGVLGRGDVERVNVVAAAAKEAGHAREHAELVFHQH